MSEMSLYSLLTDGKGVDRSQLLLSVLEIEYAGRIRDAWVEMQDDQPVIAIFTRNGGGNRECSNEGLSNEMNQKYGIDPDKCNTAECGCYGCVQEYVLPAHANYLRDEDDDFDRTYCTTYFSVPEKYVDALRNVAVDHRDPVAELLSVVDVLKPAPSSADAE